MLVHYCAREDGAPAHGADADQSEQADDEGVVVIRRASEEERKRGPERREGRAVEHADQTCVCEHGVAEGEQDDVPEERRVGLDGALPVRLRVRGGVIWHEEPEEDEDEVLQAECDPVDIAPADVEGHNAAEEPCYEHAQEQT